jgi:hypothetical protein
MKIALCTAAAILALFALDRLALWMESRGWIYYRRRKPQSSALGNAFLQVQALIEPDTKHLLEARQEDVCEADESGDPPDPAGPAAGCSVSREPDSNKPVAS